MNEFKNIWESKRRQLILLTVVIAFIAAYAIASGVYETSWADWLVLPVILIVSLPPVLLLQ